MQSIRIVSDFEWRYLNEYQAECWLRGDAGGDISVIPDATRVENPAEDTFVVPVS